MLTSEVIIEGLFRPVFVVLAACVLSLSLLRLLIFFVLEPGPLVRPSLHYRPSSLSERLIETLPSLQSAYSIPAGCCFVSTSVCRTVANVLIGTVGSRACTSPWTGVRFFREYLLTDDEDRLMALDWFQSNHHPIVQIHQQSWIVIVMPAGSSWICDSHRHVRSMCQRLADQRHRVVIWNRRECKSTTDLLDSKNGPSATSSSSSPVSQLRQVIQYISSQHADWPVALVGFSYSASIIVSYLGEYGSSSLVHSAIAVSPLWRPCASAGHLFEWLFEFRTSDTAIDPLGDSDDIAVPLLVIHYDDDPFVPVGTLPHELFTLYPQFLLVTCPLGGHCGQLQSTPLVDDIVADYIRQVLPFTGWPLTNAAGQDAQKHPGRNRVGSTTTTTRKSRKHHFKYGRPSSNSCWSYCLRILSQILMISDWSLRRLWLFPISNIYIDMIDGYVTCSWFETLNTSHK